MVYFYSYLYAVLYVYCRCLVPVRFIPLVLCTTVSTTWDLNQKTSGYEFICFGKGEGQLAHWVVEPSRKVWEANQEPSNAHPMLFFVLQLLYLICTHESLPIHICVDTRTLSVKRELISKTTAKMAQTGSFLHPKEQSGFLYRHYGSMALWYGSMTLWCLALWLSSQVLNSTEASGLPSHCWPPLIYASQHLPQIIMCFSQTHCLYTKCYIWLLDSIT